jgi:sucrose-6F-phosphate phosphohydrolase
MFAVLKEVTVAKFLLVTDLDNTLVGDDNALEKLNQRLDQHRQANGTVIVYSTGRSLTSYQGLKAERQLLEPDALITSVGTEIYRDGGETPDSAWSAKLSQGWDRNLVVATGAHFADLVPQPESEQRPFKVSYFLTQDASVEVLPQLEALLRERDLDVRLIYSSSKDLDILPRHGNKGEAMVFLRQSLGIAPTQTVVCGDSGNDQALFSAGEERGIVVGNAQTELLEWHYATPSPNRYLARAHCAGGILEGLNHFSFL